jgi:hypothetical protein
VRVFLGLALGVVLAVDRHPLAGDHRGGQPGPEAEHVRDRRVEIHAAMRLAAVQVQRDREDGQLGGDQEEVPMASEHEIETTLLVQVVAKKRKDGRFGLRVEQALIGPSLLDVPDERGWQRWERIDQGHRPASTEIVYDVAWGATGMQSIELVEFKATSARPSTGGNRRSGLGEKSGPGW